MRAEYTPKLTAVELGVLLVEQRAHRGDDLDMLAQRSAGMFSVEDLEAVEAGRHPFGANALQELIALYALDPESDSSDRRNVILDLEASTLQVGTWSIDFDSSVADDVLHQYIELVRRIRGAPRAAELALRGGDVSALASGLERTGAEIQHRLDTFMASIREPERAVWMARLSRIAGVGLVCALAAMAVNGAASQLGPETESVTGESAAIVATLVASESTGPYGVSPVADLDPATARVASPAGLRFAVATLSSSAPGPNVVGEADEIGTAVVVVASDPDRVRRRRADAIEALIPIDLAAALPEWTIGYGTSHAEWRGVTNSASRTIVVYDRADTSIYGAAEVLAHEIGHAIDLTYLTDQDRAVWLDLRQLPYVWWAGEGSPDFSVGAGDFAEAVAMYLVGSPSDSVFGDFGDPELAFVESVLGRVGSAALRETAAP